MSGMNTIYHGPTENEIVGYNHHPSVPNSGGPSVFLKCLSCGEVFRKKQKDMRNRNFCSRDCFNAHRQHAGGDGDE